MLSTLDGAVSGQGLDSDPADEVDPVAEILAEERE
jgi:hypothetical protein